MAACAVVPMETAEGPEPCAVLACRGRGEQAAAAVERANARLAEFQRVRRWVLWPEPDLPRTSTGKVRRKVVAEWLKRIQSAASAGAHASGNGNGRLGRSDDWLLAMIAQVTGEDPGVGDELHLTEDLHLDSLGRVQLAAAIEERLGCCRGRGLDGVQTLGELRRLMAGENERASRTSDEASGQRRDRSKRMRSGQRSERCGRRNELTRTTRRACEASSGDGMFIRHGRGGCR